MSDKATILIVEDENDIREILKIFVESLGFEALVAEDGSKGLQLARDHSVDVVISDLMMPNVSGMMMLNELRRSGFTNPFIFVTAYPSQEASIQALRLGAFDFLEKPFEGSQVRALLKEAVKASKTTNTFTKIVHGGIREDVGANEAKAVVAAKAYSDEERKKLVELFVSEVIKQLPICEKSLEGLKIPEVQKWEVGYLMRTMQAFRASSFALQLNEISDVANDLEWISMRARLDPSLIDEEFMAKFSKGLESLKEKVKNLTSLK